MKKLFAFCFAALLAGSAQAQVGLTGQGNVPPANMPALTGSCTTTAGAVATVCEQDGAASTYAPALAHSGVAPTAENGTGSWYKQIGTKLYLVTIVYNITTLGSPTGYVSFTLPLSMTAALSGACAAVNSTGPAAGGAAELVATNANIFFVPTAYAATTYYVTCTVSVS